MADDDRRDGRGTRDTRDTIRIVAVLILVAVLVAFVLDNTDDVEIGYVVGDSEIPLIVVLVATALLGALIDRLAQWTRRR